MVQERMPATQRRDQILDVCRRLADEQGFGAVTINAVAAESGVTRTVIYHQFGGLLGMQIALLDREFESAAAGFTTAVTPIDEELSIRSIVERVLAVVDEDPATWRLFMIPPEGAPPELYERLSWARTTVLDYLVNLVRTGTAPADLTDTDLTARTLHAAYDELVRLHLRDPETYTVARIATHAERITEAILGVESGHRIPPGPMPAPHVEST
ncbi:TetR/AcrR family transcriptional regulator [Nocardia sp. NPDC059240]|uniref:TetR/AcrR family transcriptional regulator n=1 Tax=Nocardia sp. NPDC059240 TaxID=3346786 RepID=UPI0036CFAD5E